MRIKITHVTLLVLSLCALASCDDKIVGDLIITNANIVNVATGEIDYGMDVVIRKDRIHNIFVHKRQSKYQSKYQSKRIIDCSNKYLIPGLWDMHAHLSIVGKESIPLFVLNGVMGVRDMGGKWSDLEEWRALGNRSDQSVFPKIKTAGPILESPQFYNLLQQILGASYTNDRIAIHSKEQAHTVVDSLSKIGVDLIKIRTVKSQEIFQAISDACQKNTLSFTGHIDENIGIQFAIESGISTIEHDLFLQSLKMDDEALESTLQAISNSDLYFTPTLLATYNYRLRSKDELIQLTNDTLNASKAFRAYLSPTLLENWQIQLSIQSLEQPMNWDSLMVPLRSFARSIADNSTVLSGTDVGVTGVLPGKGLHDELVLLVEEIGLSNLQALQASTIHAVQSLGLENEYGLVQSDFKADLLVLNGNPISDISNTSDFFSIVRNGMILDQKEIQMRLSEVAADVRAAKEKYEPQKLDHLRDVLAKMNAVAN